MIDAARIARCLLGALVLAVGPAAAQQPAAADVVIGYVEVAGDPRYQPVKAAERLVLKTREHPFVGAQIGIDEAKALARVLPFGFALERMSVPSPAEVAAAVARAEKRGIRFFLIDAPAEAFKPLVEAVRGKDVLLFNVSAPDDALRRDLCAAEIVHAIPSLAMRMDALVQYLVSRKWRDILVLEGPLSADAATVNALERSAKKFGARIVARQKFKVGTDPRERDLNNPLLLTSGSRDYDAVFVADDAFDFVRQVPFRTQRARPVVGGIDLEPLAWHWTFERHGAPQVNTRFQALANGRHMESADWAAWIAVRMVVKSALAVRAGDFSAQRKHILGGASFDGAKGLAVSVRPWDHQLRQAILLATPWAVIARAPVEGFLHRINDLDTLGDDEAESPCRLNK